MLVLLHTTGCTNLGRCSLILLCQNMQRDLYSFSPRKASTCAATPFIAWWKMWGRTSKHGCWLGSRPPSSWVIEYCQTSDRIKYLWYCCNNMSYVINNMNHVLYPRLGLLLTWSNYPFTDILRRWLTRSTF